MLRRILLITCVAGLLAAVVPAAPAGAAQATDGFLYGTVTTRSGTSYTGVIRWGSEEAFWDDLFHSSKEDLPYAERAPEDERDRDGWEWLRVFGRRVHIDSGGMSRIFIVRFGDISKIEVTGGDDAEVTLRDGSVIEVSGYANDVGGTIVVLDQSVGDIELKWRKIDTIEFKPTPSGVDTAGERLSGTVWTDAGTFRGFVMWDSQECLTTDELDGDSDDGRMSIPMGKIRSIERRSRNSAQVALTDGRELVLDGTNDVDHSIRGIMIEDPRYGRVKVPWSAFEKAEFEVAATSGRGYGEYARQRALTGTVTTSGGERHKGRIVFDLDETASWEMLNGDRFDIEYTIPFDRIVKVAPRGRSSAIVTLQDGEELRLEDGQDVSDRNDGVLIFTRDDDEPEYVAWDDLKFIELDW